MRRGRQHFGHLKPGDLIDGVIRRKEKAIDRRRNQHGGHQRQQSEKPCPACEQHHLARHHAINGAHSDLQRRDLPGVADQGFQF